MNPKSILKRIWTRPGGVISQKEAEFLNASTKDLPESETLLGRCLHLCGLRDKWQAEGSPATFEWVERNT